ncbi:hypothetical protein WOLCODRAFT_154285 [Wolfiporia cocos MD-104 SS10]|uniref:Uncharacterized protein n=1 Tax=Wolfiporia cocos (strain MD-104) TaxID=742152 RepID=A0A2H3K741_WOLCO|nr:hypothetical protein WOLCODRAFT_154285 [Wolfiporia cocos MD-104 SS10]
MKEAGGMLAGYLQPQAAGARSVRETVPPHNNLSTVQLQSLIHQLDMAAWLPKVGLYNLNDGPMISSPRVPCLSRRSPVAECEGETTLPDLRGDLARGVASRPPTTCPEVCHSQQKGVAGCAAMRAEAATVPPEVAPHARCLCCEL